MSRPVSEVKVLVVDDQPVIVEQLCEFLETKGYVCIPAHSTDEAIERYVADPAIGLLICDLHMPERDGIELVRALKGLDGSPRMFEAIMLTGRAEKQDVIRALREGFADYYQKPMDLDELLAGVRRQEEALLERQRNFRDLGGLNQRLQELADSVDELYQDLEKARGQGTHRRASDVEESESELPAAFEKLSPRQLEVARLVSKGKTNYQIACELGITENTVKLYVSQVLRLTHMHNRTQLALALTPSSSPVHQRFTTH
ncbi:TPA: response regulator transcription factor [Pseudomonas putida]|uniref:Two component transcriptional regulator, LuxR family n=1 Tax=Pseudomonas putida (strain GB-1) TaxID=76869 RepID=B0KLC6_PSEPG|nr:MULTISPECIES: response regulator transcription factor [Pseudomonas]MBP0711025.1 response regulator transcription factor [Pseudomonas sp. T34]MCE1003552.1 response regulator transcription factor [Pseudomonas sp. NMI1173_11]MCK2190475.1 response regulator transcription factor [Pseudomonas sp. MB04B]NOG91372.1 response regulator transcription factor [Pseudomonas sp. SbB1]NWL05395.1 DNA-binding response regulator [Pseudomonas hunanensis]